MKTWEQSVGSLLFVLCLTGVGQIAHGDDEIRTEKFPFAIQIETLQIDNSGEESSAAGAEASLSMANPNNEDFAKLGGSFGKVGDRFVGSFQMFFGPKRGDRVSLISHVIFNGYADYDHGRLDLGKFGLHIPTIKKGYVHVELPVIATMHVDRMNDIMFASHGPYLSFKQPLGYGIEVFSQAIISALFKGKSSPETEVVASTPYSQVIVLTKPGRKQKGLGHFVSGKFGVSKKIRRKGTLSLSLQVTDTQYTSYETALDGSRLSGDEDREITSITGVLEGKIDF